MSVTAGKIACAVVVALIQIGSISAAHAAYSVSAAAANIHRQHVVCSAACPAGEVSIFSTAADHPMCGTITPAAQAPAAPAPVPEARAQQAARSCGQHWSDWAPRGRTENSCPSGCKRVSSLREQFRGSGRQAEHRELVECTRR